jgi:acyl-CoA hydrolase
VDHLEFDTPLLVTENLKVNTYVIYTGSTTIYVKSDMYSKKPEDKNWNYKGHTIFIMAARKGTQSYKVPQMEFEGEEQSKNAKVRQLLGNELKEYIIGININLYK